MESMAVPNARGAAEGRSSGIHNFNGRSYDD